MSENNIKGIMDTTMDKLRTMVDADIITGTPIEVGDITLIPVSKVAFGFGAGGSEFGGAVMKEEGLKSNFGGGSGAGVSINPVAFLVVSNGNVRLLTLSSSSTSVDKIIDMVPEIITKFKDTFKSKEEKPEKIKFKSELDDIVITD